MRQGLRSGPFGSAMDRGGVKGKGRSMKTLDTQPVSCPVFPACSELWRCPHPLCVAGVPHS